MSNVITLSGLGQSGGGVPGCDGVAPGFCDNGSMWIPLTDNIDTTGLVQVNLEAMPACVCGLEKNSVYHYDAKVDRYYATHEGACDYMWDPHNYVPPGDSSSSPSPSQSGEMKWYHYAILGGLGAGAGYLVFKDRGSGGVASVIGGGLSVLAVGAFRPGGWLRAEKVAGVRK